jgi:hypothetical protein
LALALTPRAAHLELLLSSPVPVSQARDLAKPLHPADGKAVRRYTARAGQTVELFESDLLAETLADVTKKIGDETFDLWDDEPRGTYIQIAERGTPTTARVVLGVGNNP